jgi:hypothetical protein
MNGVDFKIARRALLDLCSLLSVDEEYWCRLNGEQKKKLLKSSKKDLLKVLGKTA